MRRSGARAFNASADPLRSQAQAPRRLSGADKKQQPARQQGGRGCSRNSGADGRSPENPVVFAANQHCRTLVERRFSAKTVDGWLPKPALCDGSRRQPGQIATQKKVRDGDLVRRWSTEL